jgi:hypothetical protein
MKRQIVVLMFVATIALLCWILVFPKLFGQ